MQEALTTLVILPINRNAGLVKSLVSLRTNLPLSTKPSSSLCNYKYETSQKSSFNIVFFLINYFSFQWKHFIYLRQVWTQLWLTSRAFTCSLKGTDSSRCGLRLVLPGNNNESYFSFCSFFSLHKNKNIFWNKFF